MEGIHTLLPDADGRSCFSPQTRPAGTAQTAARHDTVGVDEGVLSPSLEEGPADHEARTRCGASPRALLHLVWSGYAGIDDGDSSSVFRQALHGELVWVLGVHGNRI